MLGSYHFSGNCDDFIFFIDNGDSQLTAVNPDQNEGDGSLEAKIYDLERENRKLEGYLHALTKLKNGTESTVELASCPAAASTGVAVAVTAVLVGGTAFALHKKQSARKNGIDASLIA